MKQCFTLISDAYFSFIDDDGWAVASHIALTTSSCRCSRF